MGAGLNAGRLPVGSAENRHHRQRSLETRRARRTDPRRGVRHMSAIPAPGRRKVSAVKPATYLVGLLLVGITAVPLLFVFLDGFRTNGQINSSATSLPHPWVWSNYRGVLTSSAFWQPLENSVIVAVIATAAARPRAA